MVYVDINGREWHDRRKFNGGARPGAGRPRSLKRQAQDALMLNYMLEKIVVKEFRHGQIRRVKKTRLQVQMEALYKKAVGGDGNVRAIHTFLNMALGKPEVQKEEKLPPKRIDLGLDEMIDRIYAEPRVPQPPPPPRTPQEKLKEIVYNLETFVREVKAAKKKRQERSDRTRLARQRAQDKNSYIIIKGQKVLTEKAAYRGNLIALARHAKSKEQKEQPFDYQYRRLS